MTRSDGEPEVGHRQQSWRDDRRFLNANRYRLSTVAAGLYADRPSIGSLVIAKAWVPDVPMRLDDVQLRWSDPTPTPAMDGTGPDSLAVRPLEFRDKRYASYAQALGSLDRPRLFENRPCYRLLDVLIDGRRAVLTFGSGTYFEIVNVCEAAAHEFALAVRAAEGGAPELSALPLRAAIGDVTDLTRRPVIPAISVLTIRQSAAGSSFVLHRRDATKVAHGGGLFQVMPVGVFQPSGAASWNHPNDFDLWRSIVREYSEEFLGQAERSGQNAAIDYENWPIYRSLTDARRAGQLSVYWLGLGIDPLSLVADLLMVAVFDSAVFDSAFGDLVATNEEGEVISGHGGSGTAEGIPFTRDAVDHLANHEPMQAAGAAVLDLAWRHRAILLGE